jgi:hypothetical protein
MPFETRKFIHRQMLVLEPETLFIFGDNMARFGLKGQAASMRGEPNAVGIPTKWYPSMRPGSFFTDADFMEVLPHLLEADLRICNHLNENKLVVWPEDGIGTNRAQLQERAPKIFEKIRMMRHFYEAHNTLNMEISNAA